MNEIAGYHATSVWVELHGHAYKNKEARANSHTTIYTCPMDGCPAKLHARAGGEIVEVGIHIHSVQTWIVERNNLYQALRRRSMDENIPLHVIYTQESIRFTMSDYPEQSNEPQKDPRELEKLEEAKLKAKFPNAMLGRGGGPGGHSAFLQKRLAKGQKFFDSGDYQMAKQRPGGLTAPFKTAVPAKTSTGDAIPTPETVPVRKTSIIQPKFQAPSQTS